MQEAPLAVEGAHLALDFNHLERRRDSFAEKSGEADAHKALSPGQPVVFFDRGHRRRTVKTLLRCALPLRLLQLFTGEGRGFVDIQI